VADTSYYSWGPVHQIIHGSGGRRVRSTFGLDEATGRLDTHELHTEDPASPGAWVENRTDHYGYDRAGNVTALVENRLYAAMRGLRVLIRGVKTLSQVIPQ